MGAPASPRIADAPDIELLGVVDCIASAERRDECPQTRGIADHETFPAKPKRFFDSLSRVVLDTIEIQSSKHESVGIPAVRQEMLLKQLSMLARNRRPGRALLSASGPSSEKP